MRHRSATMGPFGAALFALVPWLAGASGDGCGFSGRGCFVGGCSGQLCLDEGSDGVSSCEWTDVYACYQQLGICERGDDDACSWRQTPELASCIAAGGP